MSESSSTEKEAFTPLPYLLLGIVFLVIALFVQMPASLLARWLPATGPVAVQAWGGTLWRGQAQLAQTESALLLAWQLRPLALLAGQVQLDLSTAGAAPLHGRLIKTPGAWQLQSLQGEIPSQLIQPFLPQGWELPGKILANNVTVMRQGLKQGDWLVAEGGLQWAGGPMQFSLNGQPKQVVLPPVALAIQQQGNHLLLVLNEAAGSLADVTLMADGQVETRLRERLLRYAPDYRSSGMDPNAVVVTAKQAL